MLTPIGVTTSDYWDAIKAGNRQHIRITFQNGVTLDDSDVNITGIEINDMLNGDTGLSFGKAVMKEFTAKLFNNSSIRTFSWGSEFALELGVEINGTTNWVSVGLFSGNRPENYPVNGVVEFHAYDRMRTMDVPASDYLRNIEYPATFADIYHGLCTFVGLQYEDGDELPNIMSRSFPASPMGTPDLTCRDVLGLLAEACGCYARINASGKVQMVWFSDQTGTEIDADYEFNLSALNIGSAMIWNVADTYTWDAFEGFTWDDLDGYKRAFHFDALNVRSSDNDIGVTVPEFSAGYTYYIIDNPFLYTDNDSDVEDYIQPIYDRLDAFEGYLPMTVECVGNWLVESGDILTVDFHGESVEMPIFVQTIRWTGAVRSTYEATGTLDKDYLPSSTHEKLTQMGRLHEIKQTIEGNYERIQDEFGNYYTKTETATEISLAVSSVIPEFDPNHSYSIGDFCSYESKIYEFTSAHSGAWNINDVVLSDVTAYVDQNAYIRQSGIDINANGVDITGSKYVRISAETNRKWVYDNGGLRYVDTANNIDLLRLSAANVGQAIPSGRAGLFFDTSDVGNYGKLFLMATYKYNNSWYYSGLYIKNNIYQYNQLVTVEPNNWAGLHVKYVGGNSNYNNDGSLYLAPSVKDTDKFIDIAYQTRNTTIWFDKSNGVSGVYYVGTVVGSSSKYIKHNIVPLENVGDIIDKLTPVSFVYDSDPDESTRFGLIYEDTIDIIPEICIEKQHEDDTSKSINYVELVPILLKEIQSLRNRVKALEESEV